MLLEAAQRNGAVDVSWKSAVTSTAALFHRHVKSVCLFFQHLQHYVHNISFSAA